jgi:hypothetical protein
LSPRTKKARCRCDTGLGIAPFGLRAERQQRSGCAGSSFAGRPAMLPWHRCVRIELDHKYDMTRFSYWLDTRLDDAQQKRFR